MTALREFQTFQQFNTFKTRTHYEGGGTKKMKSKKFEFRNFTV